MSQAELMQVSVRLPTRLLFSCEASKVFAQAENLYTWSKWRGWDAESTRAVDYGQYPTPRTVSFGVEVQF